MIVVTVVGLLATMCVPQWIKHRDQARLNTIYNNLRQLEAAKDEWAVETHRVTGAPISDVSVVSDYIGRGAIRTVINEQYVPNPVGTPAGAQLPSDVALVNYSAGSVIVLTNQ